MRIYCPTCKSKAIIRTSEDISELLREVRCICSNTECGHTFVVNVSYARTISPSVLSFPEKIREQISQKSPRELLSLLGRLS